ncbi:MAG TPA: hypothetical protein PLX69_02425 [Leptospiraceae bacterium]|nr:hypothetical protein [Leptospiraceae bacterium]HRG73392.1 hypothetical protein [Leptospiraceae bacterium]
MKTQNSKFLLLIFCIFTNSLLAIDKSVLEKNFEVFQKNPSIQLVFYFQGFEQNRSVFYGKSSPVNAEDVIEEIKVYSTYIHIKYTNRGKGEYYNDLYISIPHITVIQATKTTIEIYLGTPKVIHTGK